MDDTGFALPEDDDARDTDMPFGPPDGQRANLTSLNHHFIPFSGGGIAHSGLGMDGRDRSVRVIVGRKGAGKTLYLRRLAAYAARDASLYAYGTQHDPPRTSDILKVCDWYHDAIAVEKWMGIWKAAILRSLVSHVQNSDRLQLTPEFELELHSTFESLCGRFTVPQSVYSQLGYIIHTHNSAKSLDGYVADARWDTLEYKLAESLKGSPPVCFYIDAIDEEFRRAPRHWLLCQKGLFSQVMRFLANDRLGGRLHLVICILDHVYSATQQTEHASRYVETPYIRMLDWNRSSIRYFLQEKLRALDARWMADPDDHTAAGWLGIDKIHNPVRRLDEDIEAYLLRHTRLLPRDVVVLGNKLCTEMARRTVAGDGPLDDAAVRRVVRRTARTFGNEQLVICANQLAADLMPRQAAELGFDNIYTGQDGEKHEGGFAYIEGLLDLLRELLDGIRVDRFGPDPMRSLKARIEQKLPESCDVLSVLWQNGLLGYTEGGVLEGQPFFYHATEDDRLRMPARKTGYVLHPILIDSLDAIKGVGAPVEPGA
ncbi:MAG TPA: hypothetical protein VFF79_01485 [Conexibacter sp.]|jgi:hypothetical protein|nr:hypothetical protein [Conexibacter sp.]